MRSLHAAAVPDQAALLPARSAGIDLTKDEPGCDFMRRNYPAAIAKHPPNAKT
jgi:hypothetical protein